MKTTTTTIIAFAVAVAFSTLSAQNDRIVNRNIDVKDKFTAISVSGGWDIILTQGNIFSVTAEANEDYIDNLIVEVAGGELRVRNKERKSVRIRRNTIGRNDVRRIHVTMPQIESIKASGGSDIAAREPVKADRLDVTLSGGSDMNMESLDCRRLAIGSSGGSDVKFKNIACTDLRLTLSGGSDASLSGKTRSLTIRASGSSDVSASKLEAGECDASFSGAADGSIFVTQRLDISVSGSSDVTCYGNPANVQKRVSGAGSLKIK